MTECVCLAFYVHECLSVIVKGIRTEEKSLEQLLKSSKRDEIYFLLCIERASCGITGIYFSLAYFSKAFNKLLLFIESPIHL